MITPCLTLVGGSGMKLQERRDWMNAAYKALADVPADLVKRGAAEAMKTADHPSKIVPAIMAYVTPIIEADRAREARLAKVFQGAALPSPPPEPVPHDETQAILRQAGLDLNDATDRSRPTQFAGGSDNPAKMPTREDYIRMGVDPAVLDSMDQAA